MSDDHDSGSGFLFLCAVVLIVGTLFLLAIGGVL